MESRQPLCTPANKQASAARPRASKATLPFSDALSPSACSFPRRAQFLAAAEDAAGFRILFSPSTSSDESISISQGHCTCSALRRVSLRFAISSAFAPCSASISSSRLCALSRSCSVEITQHRQGANRKKRRRTTCCSIFLNLSSSSLPCEH